MVDAAPRTRLGTLYNRRGISDSAAGGQKGRIPVDCP